MFLGLPKSKNLYLEENTATQVVETSESQANWKRQKIGSSQAKSPGASSANFRASGDDTTTRKVDELQISAENQILVVKEKEASDPTEGLSVSHSQPTIYLLTTVQLGCV